MKFGVTKPETRNIFQHASHTVR